MITVEVANHYSDDLAAGIGKLMPVLNQDFGDAPIDAELLKFIIDSPSHGLFVARNDSEIVGVAVLSIVICIGNGRGAYLESFVVSPQFQGQGISSKIWDEMLRWARAKGCQKLEFTSNPKRQRAIAFYQKHGTTIYPTNFFRKTL
jgi:ribosomal protein S18 acetylase RimI-like enzyme